MTYLLLYLPFKKTFDERADRNHRDGKLKKNYSITQAKEKYDEGEIRMKGSLQKIIPKVWEWTNIKHSKNNETSFMKYNTNGLLGN